MLRIIEELGPASWLHPDIQDNEVAATLLLSELQYVCQMINDCKLQFLRLKIRWYFIVEKKLFNLLCKYFLSFYLH